MAKPKSKLGRTAPSKVTINGTSSPQSTKKKASSLRQQDDFVLTISDSDEIPDDESDIDVASDEDVPASRQKEAERLPVISQEADAESRGKKRKRGAELADGVVNGNAAKSRKKDEDIDSDFEFQVGDLDDGLEELDGWGFEGAKAAMSTHKKGVDIDELISKRKAKKGVAEESDSEEEEEEDEEMEDAEDEEEEEEDMVGKLLEDEESGSEFGAEAESDDEGSEGGVKLDADSEEEEDEDEDENAEESDAESVLSEVAHPDDDAESASGSESESESEESRAAKAAFFAPETEQQASGLSFVQMQISRPILKALAKANFTNPTAIQSRTIPFALAGKDIVGGAVTGSGKTAAYVVPILERLVHRKRSVPTTHAVVLTPTRELAMQVQAVVEKLKAFTDIKSTVIVGGLSLKAQEAELRKRPEIVIATPGRFIDHMRNSPSFHVDGIEILVLDEADRMLEDGFADELDEILRTLPKRRQTMLFSATMTDSIEKLVRIGMRQPMRLLVDPKKSTVSTLTQEFIRIRPGREGGRLAMLVLLVKEFYKARCIVFFRSKVYAHRVRILFGLLGLKAAELHGSLSQEQRIKSVEAFRDGEVDFLLATDLASRGLDIKNVSYVINFELPQSHEIYLHRVGRTARAGRSGRAITLAAEADRKIVKKAIKAGQEHGKVVSRSLDVEKVDQLTEKLKGMEDDIEGILEDEKEEKQLLQVEMQLRKGENLIRYEDEINSRPKRTWFESEKDKKKAKEAGKAELNGVSGKLLDKKKKVKLSGKMKKKLESRDEVKGDGARLFKKTKVQRQEGSKRGVKAGNMSKKGGSGAKGKSGKKFAQKLGKGRR